MKKYCIESIKNLEKAKIVCSRFKLWAKRWKVQIDPRVLIVGSPC